MKDAGICWNKKDKATQENITVKVVEINPKVLAREGRLKRYQQRVDKYRENVIPKKLKINLSTTRRKSFKNIPATGCRINRTIEIWQLKNRMKRPNR